MEQLVKYVLYPLNNRFTILIEEYKKNNGLTDVSEILIL